MLHKREKCLFIFIFIRNVVSLSIQTLLDVMQPTYAILRHKTVTPTPKPIDSDLCRPNDSHIYRTSGAAATAISLLIASAESSLGLPSNNRLHHIGGSKGREPLCSGGYTSEKKYHTWPITTPIISSFGTVPCNTKLNPINTHGRYGAVNTINPRKLNRVSGLRLDHI